ncbi:hypothetical protein N3K66_005658 [Trichothecium roseum]|uniref:Uncharacterized protein n=1 Tax=Trichothecium roseum TaxID=47278 RepID=A0ACC0UYG4_9HYPO|nr:hypothetical protein N3K66_005658 [Trichothecium roseum]
MASLAGQDGRKTTPPPPSAPTSYQKVFSQVPVTALAFYTDKQHDLLLAGEHADILVYQCESRKLVLRQRIFDDQPIHGVRVDGDQAVFWGSSHIAVANLNGCNDGRPLVVKRCTAPDWVFDAAASPFDTNLYVLATAHNEIVTVRYEKDTDLLLLGRVIAPARPGLYSAQLAWISANCVLMVAGTAFGEILVWKSHLDRHGPDAHEMLYVLTGHEGSIYGVDISEPVILPDGTTGRLMATCSDDRTVRIWDISEREDDVKGPDHDFNAPRETGFAASLPGEAKPSLESKPPMAVAMGHLSRIWGVRISLPPGGGLADGGITVYTFGEDSTTQKWHMCIDSGATLPLKGTLQHQQTFSLHDGKHIWANNMLSRGNRRVIATGGADSKISLIDECAEDGKSLSSTVILDIPDIYPTPLQTGKGLEIVNRFDMISANEVLVVTSAGRLSVGSLVEGGVPIWEHVTIPEELEEDMKKCYVLRRAAPGTALLGLTSGDVYFYNRSKGTISFVVKVPRKTVDVTLLRADEQSMSILVHMFGTACPQYFTLDAASGAVVEEIPVTGVDSRFVVISATLVHHFLVLGSRHGWISILRQGTGGYTQVLHVPPRTGDCITSITPLPSKQSSPIYLLTTHRDGYFRILEVQESSEGVQVHLRHESSPPFGPMIEGAWFTEDENSPELILYGFKSKSFVVWNESRREECANVDCGGAHRTFNFWHGPSASSPMRFAFTRVSKLALYSQNRPVARTAKPGTHGREIRSLSANNRYLATGSEDTTVRIWEPRGLNAGNSGEREMRPVAVMRAHVTGIQTLKWLGEDYLLSSSGLEDLFIWRVRTLDADYKGLAVVREAAFDDRSPDGDLRIMDFDVYRIGDDTLVVTMVLSNSMLRSYYYTAEGGFSVAVKGSYTGACLTQIRHLNKPGDEIAVLTASTDGRVVVWFSMEMEQGELMFVTDQVAPLHQSSIKALDMVELLSSGERYILTAGDDNALGLTVLSPGPDRRILNRGIVRRAHAAGINGVVVTATTTVTTTAPGSGGPEVVVMCTTVSNDQRVKTWRVRTGRDCRIEKVSEVRSGVADPSDVGLLGEHVVVGGVGLEVWRPV